MTQTTYLARYMASYLLLKLLHFNSSQSHAGVATDFIFTDKHQPNFIGAIQNQVHSYTNLITETIHDRVEKQLKL